MARWWVTLILAAGTLPAATPIFPLRDIKPGLRGVGRTVFQGDRIEEFQVEILGVLENVGPKQSLILARLSGGPLDRAGVLQGMSGSPVYLDGRLAGAVAMAFPYAKEPIAGIRPIEEMTRPAATVRAPRRAAIDPKELLAGLPKRGETLVGSERMVEIATPASFGGFTRGAIEQFAPQLRALGLEPTQGLASGGRAGGKLGDPGTLKPGSMISVLLVTGDYSVGADGTLTHIDGDQVYAFGHRFLSVGSTDLPFTRAEVITLVPTLTTSFKISASKELMGVISGDRSTGISGRLGRRAAMAPVSIAVGKSDYRMEIVNDRFLSPFLLQMVLYSAIDATERVSGASTFSLKGEVEFEGMKTPLRLDNLYAADSGGPMMVAASASAPLAYVMQGGFEDLRVRGIKLRVEPSEQKKQVQIDQAYPAHPQVRPGETVDLRVSLRGENGAEQLRRLSYRTPVGMTPGPLYFTVSDAFTANLTEFRQLIGQPARSAAQLIETLNELKPNTKAYVRVWRPEASYTVAGEDFPSPPPSLGLMLGKSQTPTFNARIAELTIDGGGSVVSGSKTIQVDVKD